MRRSTILLLAILGLVAILFLVSRCKPADVVGPGPTAVEGQLASDARMGALFTERDPERLIGRRAGRSPRS